MKTTRYFLISSIAILLLVSFSACKKEAEPAAELSSRVVGNYTLTGIRQNGTLYTVNSKTVGKMNVVRESATSVQLSVDVSNGNAAENIQFTANNVTLQEAGNNEVNLLKDNASFAKGGNNSLSIKVAPTDGSTPFELIGSK
ncbi:hypothetical protein IC229_04930 [Spirosoma sp. BT702]|uniref:Lipocalin-like domain-containing protein n=1 Tax=Spirosoma profusum TaxID=2771354 RepID=A0A926XTR1_9BACT|nr:hypothetical protein [Spirosoma profusum]MBD2699967.1 hypothetical protein [Spirosoma profusum]